MNASILPPSSSPAAGLSRSKRTLDAGRGATISAPIQLLAVIPRERLLTARGMRPLLVSWFETRSSAAFLLTRELASPPHSIAAAGWPGDPHAQRATASNRFQPSRSG